MSQEAYNEVMREKENIVLRQQERDKKMQISVPMSAWDLTTILAVFDVSGLAHGDEMSPEIHELYTRLLAENAKIER